ncbi:hypothetical protein ACFL67_02955, partial [candidate division KSB1 bacterium]
KAGIILSGHYIEAKLAPRVGLKPTSRSFGITDINPIFVTSVKTSPAQNRANETTMDNNG